MDIEAMQYLLIDELCVEPQVRKRVSRAAVERVKQSIIRHGLMQPIRVRRAGNRFVVVFGHVRLLAAKLAGLKKIKVIIEDGELSEAEIIERQLAENRCREELRPVEFGEAIERLMLLSQRNLSEVAEHLDESIATISKYRALLTLPKDIQAKVDAGEISVSAAYELTHTKNAAEQAQLAAEITHGGLTRDGLVSKRKEKRRSPKTPRSESKSTPDQRVSPRKRRLTLQGPHIDNVAELITWLEELLSVAKGQPTAELPAVIDVFKAIARRGLETCAA